MYSKKTRLSAMLICIMLVITALSSAFLVIREENHHCSGEDCPVCACLHKAEKTLRSIGAAAPEQAVSIIIPVLYLLLCLSGTWSGLHLSFLIQQKIRLNN